MVGTMREDGRASPVIDPVEGVLAVLDRGSTTGTNKLGLLLALLELAPSAPDGRIEIHLIAEKLLEIHWDHVRPFPLGAGSEAVTLTQVTSGNKEAAVITQAKRLRDELPARARDWPFARARRLIEDSTVWDDALEEIRRNAKRNPIDKLQMIDGQRYAFLYTTEPDAIVLTPRAAAELTRYGPVLKELIQARFVRQVMTANKALTRSPVEMAIEKHLFGAEREMPSAALRSELVLLQHGRCLYTGEPLAGGVTPELDHVIPWSRVRISALGNFAVTTKQTNSAKSDLLLACTPLRRWIEHITGHEAQLAALAGSTGWPEGVKDAMAVARAVYRSAGRGGVLWSPEGARPAEPQELREIDSMLQDALM
jgi:hypothetical protein